MILSQLRCTHTLVAYTTLLLVMLASMNLNQLILTTLSLFSEYGVEAFAEVPSWQDLFITPFFGAVVGEIMFEAEQDIVANGGEVWGSETMGSVSLFFLNPVGHIHGWVSDAWGGSAEFGSTQNLGLVIKMLLNLL